MRIYVNKEHIERGIKNDCGKCPIALALLEQVPDIKFALIDTETIGFLVSNSGKWIEKNHTVKTGKFIQDFDCGKSVKPFHFEMRVK